MRFQEMRTLSLQKQQLNPWAKKVGQWAGGARAMLSSPCECCQQGPESRASSRAAGQSWNCLSKAEILAITRSDPSLVVPVGCCQTQTQFSSTRIHLRFRSPGFHRSLWTKHESQSKITKHARKWSFVRKKNHTHHIAVFKKLDVGIGRYKTWNNYKMFKN